MSEIECIHSVSVHLEYWEDTTKHISNWTEQCDYVKTHILDLSCSCKVYLLRFLVLSAGLLAVKAVPGYWQIHSSC